jgi:hypothetical protein
MKILGSSLISSRYHIATHNFYISRCVFFHCDWRLKISKFWSKRSLKSTFNSFEMVFYWDESYQAKSNFICCDNSLHWAFSPWFLHPHPQKLELIAESDLIYLIKLTSNTHVHSMNFKKDFDSFIFMNSVLFSSLDLWTWANTDSSNQTCILVKITLFWICAKKNKQKAWWVIVLF